MSKQYAVISVGTNSTRMLLANVAPDVPHIDAVRSLGTRIGEGLDAEGRLGEEPMRRTLDAIGQLYRQVRGHYVKLFAVSTSAVRRAGNSDEFLERAREILGVPMHVLSGEEEAEASYRGAITALGPLHGERVAVVDTGGGSTEYAAGTTTKPERVISCEVGAVRLTEALPALAGNRGPVDAETIERARSIAREALAPLNDSEPVERVAFVGGSATTTAGIVRAAQRSRRFLSTLARGSAKRTGAHIRPDRSKDRKNVIGMNPQRADILPAGIIVLDTVLEILKRDAATATTDDLLLGVLLQHRDASGSRAGAGKPTIAGSRTPRGFK